MVSEKRLKEKAKKISIYEGAAYSFSEGFGLRNISAYALILIKLDSLISLLTSIPSLLGNLSQFFSHTILKKTKSRKKAISLLVFLQSILWLFLIVPGLIFIYNRDFSQQSFFILLLFYTLLIIFGSLSGPIWSSWMKDIVGEKELGKYFSKRNKIILILIIISSFLAGLFLDFFKKRWNVLYAFFILFFFSFLARAFSAYLFTKKYEPEYKIKEDKKFGFKQFLDNMPYNNFGKFVIFLSLLNFFVAVASPFFVVYLLRMKQLSYTFYSLTLLIMTSMSVLTMSFWGRISDRKGNLKIFKLTLIGICFIPLIYLISNFIENKILFFSLIFLIEAISGFCWGGFNLASSNFIFKIVSREKMVYCTSYLNILNGISVFLGASLGGYIVSKNISLIDPILFVFLISFIGRATTYLFLLNKIKEEKGKFSYQNHFFSTKIFSIPRSFFEHTEQFSLMFFKKAKNHFKLSKTF